MTWKCEWTPTHSRPERVLHPMEKPIAQSYFDRWSVRVDVDRLRRRMLLRVSRPFTYFTGLWNSSIKSMLISIIFVKGAKELFRRRGTLKEKKKRVN